MTLLPIGYSGADECPAVGVRIKASDPNPFDSFGRGVSIWGDTVVVGAFWDDQNGPDAGAAYVFARENRNWVQTQKLIASDGEGSDWFGRTLAVEGATIFVASNQGKVYVYHRDGATWAEVQQLLPSDVPEGDSGGFGRSIAASVDRAIIGAPSFEDDDNFIFGVAFVFRRDPQTMEWIEEAQLLQPDLPNIPGLGQGFGLVVALHGDIAVIGAIGDDSACPEDPICDSGAAYVFRYDSESETWFEEQKLLASDAAWGDNFGLGVAVHGDVALIGAPFHDDNGTSSGVVYVFRFDPKTSQWIEQQKLLASDGQGADAFGNVVAVDGDLAVIGAAGADDVGSNSGAAYVFRRNAQGVWVEQCKLVPGPNPWTQFFARRSVAIDGTRVIIGAHGEDQQQGAAYIYDLSFNPADLDADGDVGPFDLALLLGNWGPCPEPCAPGDPAQTCPADLNGDCQVEAFDLAILLGDWG